MIHDRRESVDPTAPAATYYTTGRNAPRQRTRTYTVSFEFRISMATKKKKYSLKKNYRELPLVLVLEIQEILPIMESNGVHPLVSNNLYIAYYPR